jgi:hypothetical protein
VWHLQGLLLSGGAQQQQQQMPLPLWLQLQYWPSC